VGIGATYLVTINVRRIYPFAKGIACQIPSSESFRVPWKRSYRLFHVLVDEMR
jgi:hypothetical protein